MRTSSHIDLTFMISCSIDIEYIFMHCVHLHSRPRKTVFTLVSTHVPLVSFPSNGDNGSKQKSHQTQGRFAWFFPQHTRIQYSSHASRYLGRLPGILVVSPTGITLHFPIPYRNHAAVLQPDNQIMRPCGFGTI